MADIKPIKLVTNAMLDSKHHHHHHHHHHHGGFKKEPGLDLASQCLSKDNLSNPSLLNSCHDSLASQMTHLTSAVAGTPAEHGFTVDSLMNVYNPRIPHGAYPYHFNEDNLSANQMRHHHPNSHGGWYAPETPPNEPLHSHPLSSSGGHSGPLTLNISTNNSPTIPISTPAAVTTSVFRDAPMYHHEHQSSTNYLDQGSPNGSLASTSPPMVLGGGGIGGGGLTGVHSNSAINNMNMHQLNNLGHYRGYYQDCVKYGV